MGSRVLLKQASLETGLSEWELSTGAKSGKYPAMRIGGNRGRWIFDIDLLQRRIEELMLKNINENHTDNDYGKLRKIRG
ncbi:MAG: hypothetical protein GX154_06035 [Clostridiales bacterium]|nr:hypothetical protein [Clostridiales bacterium]